MAYNPERDQIALTSFGFSEVWVIDHSTTRTEAAGHSGGKGGKGGDLLYRWGNPRAYRHGTTADRALPGLPARRPLDRARAPGRGAPAGVQQGGGAAGGRGLVGGGGGPPDRFERPLHAASTIRIRTRQGGVELQG